ncbi:MAG: aldo/keto reductase [Gemmatimonadaceae bacterium]
MTTTSSRARAAALAGHATAAGTARYGARAAAKLSSDFLRPLTHEGVLVSSIGLGSYLGECDEADDIRYADTAHHAIATGINLLDTAINYRCQRSERAFGKALSRAVRMETAARDEIVVCTKGGYIPLDGTQPASREEYNDYVKREYIDSGILAADDIVAGGHCLAPAFLADQLARSRANLGVETIDLYYLHNPEQQLDAIDDATLELRLRAAFELLEARCAAGEIGGYGCATWNGLRTPPGERGHLSLAMLVRLAREIAGDDHHFHAVQLPVNLALNEAVRTQTQRIGDRPLTVLEAASELGVAVVASASLLQAKLASKLPQQMREALPGLTTDAQRAIAFVRGLPVIASALVGMRSAGHVRENLAAARANNSTLNA